MGPFEAAGRGRQRTVVLRYFPDGASMLLAAANDGGASHPGWYLNLTAEPDARVEVGGPLDPDPAPDSRPACRRIGPLRRLMRMMCG
jgi:hypothetical protein